MQSQKHPFKKQRRVYAAVVPAVLVAASFAMWLVFTLQKAEKPARILLTAFIIGVAAAALCSGLFLARWAMQNRPKKQYESTNKNDRLFAVIGWLFIGLIGLPVYYVYNLVAMFIGPKKVGETTKHEVDFSEQSPTDQSTPSSTASGFDNNSTDE